MRNLFLSLAIFGISSCSTIPHGLSEWSDWKAAQQANYVEGPTAILKNVDYSYLPEGAVAYVTEKGGEVELTRDPDDEAETLWRIRHEKGDVLWTPMSENAVLPEGGVVDRSLVLSDRYTLIKSTEYIDLTEQQIRLILFDDQSDAVTRFQGLSFFPYSPDGHITASYLPNREARPVILDTERGLTKRFYELGKARFNVDGNVVELPMFSYQKPDADTDIESLFTGFTDATSGNTSYGVGRYLDVSGFGTYPPTTLKLDFNRLYNPYCARTDAYNCPVIPTHIEAAMPFGERFDESK